MTDVLNPVEIESAIRHVAERIAKGVRVCSETYAAKLSAERDYEQAFARAYLRHDGPQTEKKHAAVLATVTECEARDLADVAYRYAASTARALEDELRALQSVGASVRAMYGAVPA